MSDREDAPFDPGLQPERTNLAWRRTGLSLVVCAAGGLRLMVEVHPLLAAAGAVVILVAAATVGVASARKYRSVHALLTSTDSDRAAIQDGLLPAFVAAMGFLGGLLALALVLLGEVPRWAR
ncbi:DUF202 domain-containing protein [Nigerium massiliense]|uniref:DUF202 domain-containing protein n=1 Tax=Nigerium massiliense TaxID=1522317 RepID=UPI000590E459|nr:DUF202 domain-containing protein [Nigerium massiliense]